MMATKKKKSSVNQKSKPAPRKSKPAQKKAKSKARKRAKSRKRNLLREISFSTLIIVTIALFIFLYIWRNGRSKVAPQVEDKSISQVVAESTLNLDDYPLNHYYPATQLKSGKIVAHLAYSLSYNEEHKQAEWLIYELTKEQALSKKIARQGNFVPDPHPSIQSAHPSDYLKSGYDKVHLSPTADNRWSAQAMAESFYMSNIVPQHPDLSGKIWSELESKVRDWAIQNGKVYVVTGAILADGYKHKIGTNQVSVPNYYYKIVADLTGEKIKGVGFIFSNGENNGELRYYACSIEDVEKRTKLNFFPNLKPEVQAQIKNDFEIEEWFK